MNQLKKIEQTQPYISLFVFKETSGFKITAFFKELVALCGAGIQDGSKTILSESPASSTYRYCHYLEERRPSWLLDGEAPEIVDRINHLLVALRAHGYLAIHATDAGAKSAITSALNREDDEVFAKLAKVSRKGFAEAFMAEAPARTLWLSGIHRRTAVKADSKILSGINLAAALDPLDDQSYHFTAARSVTEVDGSDAAIGSAPRKSKLWMRGSRDWKDFKATVGAILKKIAVAEKSGGDYIPPLPVLAGAVTVEDLKAVKGAFDINFVAPELLQEEFGGMNEAALEEAEDWAYRTSFSNIKSDSKNGQLVTTASARLMDEEIGEFQITLEPRSGLDAPRITLSPSESDPKTVHDRLADLCKRKNWLRIRFESGHTLSDGRFYEMRPRDEIFREWSFHDFKEGSETNPKEEKPTVPTPPKKPGGDPGAKFDPEEIGQQDSLFCWVAKNWWGLKVAKLTGGSNGFELKAGLSLGSKKGWLLCDDKSMETADFIFIDEEPSDGLEPMVSMIHVKGSKSDGANRGVSVSDFEVVCGQAVKNLRFLDRRNLHEQLEAGRDNGVAIATWQNGYSKIDPQKKNPRARALKALKNLGENYRRRVVVLQPRVLREECIKSNKAVVGRRPTQGAQRMRQLNTLLLGVEADCRSLGADFVVVSSLRGAS